MMKRTFFFIDASTRTTYVESTKPFFCQKLASKQTQTILDIAFYKLNWHEYLSNFMWQWSPGTKKVDSNHKNWSDIANRNRNQECLSTAKKFIDLFSAKNYEHVFSSLI